MSDLKDLATAFGWNIKDMANVMGYTRQGLYICLNEGRVQNTRMHAALQHLKEISQTQYQQDLEQAERLKSVRDQGINDLADRFGLCGESEVIT